MKKRIVLLLSVVCMGARGGESRFFRIGCLEVGLPENLTITRDELGQIFLEFDTVAEGEYTIQAADCLVPSAWTTVSTVTGDGARVGWLTTRRWSRTFGGSGDDEAYSVQQTSDGGYIVACDTESFGAGGRDIYLVKTDQNGNELWSKTFGGGATDWASSVHQTSDGGYIVAGTTYSFGAGRSDVWLIKTDQDGTEVWSRTLGGASYDYAASVQQTSDGGYIVAGWTYSTALGWTDAYLIKTDQDGKKVWSRTFGGSDDDDEANSVQQTSDGGYILAGRTFSYTASSGNAHLVKSADIYLIKTDQDGNEVWSRTFGESDDDWATSVQQTSDGGYIIAGCIGRFAPGGADAYLIKTDQNGAELWSRRLGGSDPDCWDWAESVQQTSDGGYILAGKTGSYAARAYDAYLIKSDQNGTEVWSRTFGGSGNDWAQSVQQTSDGGYIVVGGTYSFGAGDADVYLIKTDQNGNAPLPE